MQTSISNYVLMNPPSLIEGIICVALFMLVLYASLKSTKHLVHLKQRAIIVSLHIVSFLLILLILFNPAYRIENYKKDKKSLAILVDNSWSMNLSGDGQSNTRDEISKNYLEQNNDFFSQIEKDFYVEYFIFDEELKPASLGSIIQNIPDGSHTKIGNVLDQLSENYNEKELDAAINYL